MCLAGLHAQWLVPPTNLIPFTLRGNRGTRIKMDQLFGRATRPVSPARARQGAKLFSLLSHFASLPQASCPQGPCSRRQSSCKSPLRLPLANVQLHEKRKGENETDRKEKNNNKKCSCAHIFREPAHHNADGLCCSEPADCAIHSEWGGTKRK